MPAIAFRKKISFGRILCTLLLIFFAFIFFLPFLWMLSTALKDKTLLFANPPQWIPNPAHWENFQQVFLRMPFLTYMKNTLILALVPALGGFLAAPMIAYSLTKIPWVGGKYLFPIILATTMIPWQVTQVPLFITWNKLHLVNTFVPLILPAFFGAPYYIYLMRQFVKGLPDSLMEAARIDGAGEFRILTSIVYPLCKPALTTVVLLICISGWNDLNGPLLYLQKGDMYTLAIGLQQFTTTATKEWDLFMAAATVFTLPLIVVFFVCQKQFIGGISTTGLK